MFSDNTSPRGSWLVVAVSGSRGVHRFMDETVTTTEIWLLSVGERACRKGVGV